MNPLPGQPDSFSTAPASGGLRHITCYLDFISPYAHLAFELLPEALQGISCSVAYKPVLFAGMLKHYGQLGPAEITPKRDWTYRQVLWLAHSRGVALQLPASHPFNPLPLLRLALACSLDAEPGAPNRYVCETVFRHVWHGGLEAGDAARLQALEATLAPRRDPQGEAVRAQLRRNTDEAVAAGVFGVPTFAVDGKLFWGLDALPMLRAFLRGDAWFDGPGWQAPAATRVGVQRQ